MTSESFCVVEVMKRITYLGYQIQNELECPLAGYTGRFELIPSTSIHGAVSIIHEYILLVLWFTFTWFHMVTIETTHESMI